MNRKTYPTSRGTISFIDHGQGPVILAIHGTPTSSAIYESLLEPLSGSFRLVIPDLLGFGDSDHLENWVSSAEEHSKILEELINHLKLTEVHLVVHDFGGPIGIGAALNTQLSIKTLTVFNSWSWSTKGTPAEKLGKTLNGSFGKWLYVRIGISSRVLLPSLFARKDRFTSALRDRLTQPFKKPESRYVLWGMARSLSQSNPFFTELEGRLKKLVNTPTLLIWGMKDKAFDTVQLQRWKSIFPGATICQAKDSGHFPMLEETELSFAALSEFLSNITQERPSSSQRD